MEQDVFDILSEEFILPFPAYDYQRTALTKSIVFDKLLFPLKVGRGKTAMATWRALWDSLAHGVEQIIFLVPATLVVQWSRWLSSIKFSDGSDLDVLTYQAPPAKRAVMDLKGVDIVVMSHQIFVKDYLRISKATQRKKVHVVYDESQDGLRKVGNKIYRNFKTFTLDKRITLLSGTPVTNPMDTYAVVKLMSPEIYPTKRFFERMHVGNTDYFGNITEWKNLEKMKAALYHKAVDIPDSAVAELPRIMKMLLTTSTGR